MRNLLAILFLAISALVASASTLAPAQPSPGKRPHTNSAAAPDPASQQPAPQNHTQQDPGERAFRNNCGRCHTPPEQLAPRITGTVLRHMRVRANLSAEDERKILSYLAP